MTDLHVYDTTLRDGAQQEGLNLSVADKLRHRPRTSTSSGSATSRAAGRAPTPRTPSSSARAPRGARPAQRHARRVRRHPARRRARPPTTRWSPRCATAGAEVVTLVAKSHDRPRRAGPAHHARGEPRDGRATPSPTCAAEGRRVFLDAEHFFDGYRADRAYALEVAADGGRGRAPRSSRSATPTAGMLPGWRRRRRRTTSSSTTGGPGRHPLPQRHRLRGRQLAGRGRRRRDARPGHASTGTASAPATPTCSRSSPTSSSSWAGSCCRAGCSATRPASRTPSPRSRTSRPYSRQPYVGVQRVRPQGRACTPARSRSTPTSTSTSTPSTSATTCGCSSPTWPAGPRSS